MMSIVNVQTMAHLKRILIDVRVLAVGLMMYPLFMNAQMTSINFDFLRVNEQPPNPEYLTILGDSLEPIGFLGTGVSIYHPNLPIYAGIRLNNAVWGVRAGYYTFGYHFGANIKLANHLSIHPKIMFTTGGGAENHDGSGWFFSPALTIDKAFGKYSLGIGGQYSFVSTGIIKGSSIYFSLNKKVDFSQSLLTPAHAQLFTNIVYSPLNSINSGIGFIGIGGRVFNKYSYQSAFLTAALTNLGGYMDVYGGYGIWNQIGSIRLLGEINLGTGGGGKAPAGGGLMYGSGVEGQYHFDNFFIGSRLGILKSFDGPFYFSFIGAHLGTELFYDSQFSQRPEYNPAYLIIENSIRTYLGKDGFSNLGIAFQLYKEGLISLRGESYWAFTHGRGAYAEGLFGLRLQHGWVYTEGQIGAGAGGGINLWNGAGLVFMNVGLDIPLSNLSTINSKLVYNLYSTTEFPELGFQVGLGYNIPFTKR
ncbi:MAG: hypothetical protein VXY91_07170 [Bacteroidota bacterium]|nr:hypothetical protein [Bacteroidota bacterium]